MISLKLVLLASLSLLLMLGTVIPVDYQVSGRCPNGYHKSPSGDCEKYIPHKGLPRCPNGSHRSPDGDCEKVNSSKSSNTKKSDSNNEKSSKKVTKKMQTETETETKVKDIGACKGIADCFEGIVTEVVDGDTIDINNVRIRLSLVNTPEIGEAGYHEAKTFTESVCGVGTHARMDEDDGQRRGSYGRIIGVVECEGTNFSLNELLLDSGHAKILQGFCGVSEFASSSWAQKGGC